MKKQEMTENEEARVILARLEEEFHGRPMIADALMRGRKALESIRCPDPETGLMPCGCGGWPDIISPNNSISLYLVQCDRCHMETDCYDTKQAIAAWNKAVGG